MKYSIRETPDGNHLYRFDNNKGPCNNAEYEFWCEIEKLKENLAVAVEALEEYIDTDPMNGPVYRKAQDALAKIKGDA